MGFAEHFIGVDDDAKCAIFCSAGWEAAPKLLLVLQNAVGSRPGLWSRSLCVSHGLGAGSMLPCLERALAEGYGVLVLNPNANSCEVAPAEPGGKPARKPIQDSSSPEDHVLHELAHRLVVSLERLA